MSFKLEPPSRQHVGKMARRSKVAAAVKKFEKEASKKTTALRRSKRIADQQLEKKLKKLEEKMAKQQQKMEERWRCSR